MHNLISLEEVKTRLNDEDVVIVDCRFDLGNKEAGRTAYLEGHIPGAFYLDLEKDLSSPVQIHGGRHPLPDVEKLAFKLGEIGIGERTTVIAYDDQDGSMAARLWWLLRYYGHDRVQVMEEGYSSWLSQGFTTTSVTPTSAPVTFVPKLRESWIVDAVGIKRLQEEDVLIDSRAPERYRGDVEPLDKKAGHIPGARNLFWMDAVKNGKWKTAQELKDQFKELTDKPVTVYCGSGVTACANFLAMTEAGLTQLKLYPGSWSDWITYDDNPIETGEPKK